MRSFAFFIFCLAISSTVTFAAGPNRPLLPKPAGDGRANVAQGPAAVSATGQQQSLHEKWAGRVNQVALNPQGSNTISAQSGAFVMTPGPKAGWTMWDEWARQQSPTKMFRLLDDRWNKIPAEERQLFPDSNAEISYAYLPLYPARRTKTVSPYNAVMKRIQIPENDHWLIQQVDQEITTLMNTAMIAESLHYGLGESENHEIVYIALKKSDSLMYLKRAVIFIALDNAWRKHTAPAESRLFKGANAEISYAFFSMFPRSGTSSYNAVIKRIQIPGNDHSLGQLVNLEIKTLTKIESFHCGHGTSENGQIVYIALKNSDINKSRLIQTELFRVLDLAWKAGRLFKYPNAEISYAFLSKFPKSKTSPRYNAVMKLIRIPDTDEGRRRVDEEITTVSKMNDEDSFQIEKSLDNNIVYIALKNDKHLIALRDERFEWLRDDTLRELKKEYPTLVFQTDASHWLCYKYNGEEYGAIYI